MESLRHVGISCIGVACSVVIYKLISSHLWSNSVFSRKWKKTTKIISRELKSRLRRFFLISRWLRSKLIFSFMCKRREKVRQKIEEEIVSLPHYQQEAENWQQTGPFKKEANGSKVVSVTHFKMAILDHESIVDAQFSGKSWDCFKKWLTVHVVLLPLARKRSVTLINAIFATFFLSSLSTIT